LTTLIERSQSENRRTIVIYSRDFHAAASRRTALSRKSNDWSKLWHSIQTAYRNWLPCRFTKRLEITTRWTCLQSGDLSDEWLI